MSRKYKFRDQKQLYFVSFATVQWVDVFTRDLYREQITESLLYCHKNKGLDIYAWCIMTNHIHLIIGTQDTPMEYIMRDLKSFTSRAIKDLLQNNLQESRREWMLNIFRKAGERNSNNKGWQFWQQHNQPIELWNAELAQQKLDYIHKNPVEAGFVSEPHEYKWSSARDYNGIKGPVPVKFLFG